MEAPRARIGDVLCGVEGCAGYESRLGSLVVLGTCMWGLMVNGRLFL